MGNIYEFLLLWIFIQSASIVTSFKPFRKQSGTLQTGCANVNAGHASIHHVLQAVALCLSKINPRIPLDFISGLQYYPKIFSTSTSLLLKYGYTSHQPSPTVFYYLCFPFDMQRHPIHPLFLYYREAVCKLSHWIDSMISLSGYNICTYEFW